MEIGFRGCTDRGQRAVAAIDTIGIDGIAVEIRDEGEFAVGRYGHRYRVCAGCYRFSGFAQRAGAGIEPVGRYDVGVFTGDIGKTVIRGNSNRIGI